MEQNPSRRDALKTLGAVPIAAGIRRFEIVSVGHDVRALQGQPQLALVSRHVQWTDIEDGAAAAAESGFRAIAWTCRGGAHILPDNVRTELPRAVEAARKAGLATPMLITSINGADTPGAEVIFDTMRKVGITRYRAPNYRYDYTKDMQSQFDALKPRVEALAKLNEKYGVTAMFHTHSSQGSVGGGLWDLWLLIRDYPPNLVAINYDIGHNTVRGGTEWNQTARYAHRHVGALSLKDMHWIRRADAPPDTWAWRHEFVVPGEGLVNFRDMFTYFKSVGFSGPLETYFEYMVDLGNGRSMNMLGTNRGQWQLEMPRAQFISLLKRDVTFYRNIFNSIGWNVG